MCGNDFYQPLPARFALAERKMPADVYQRYLDLCTDTSYFAMIANNEPERKAYAEAEIAKAEAALALLDEEYQIRD